MNFSPLDLFWIFLAILLFVPYIQRRALTLRRLRLIRMLEELRKSRVITLIHRQETFGLLGLPLARFISMEDSEQVLRAIHLTPSDMPIDMIVHSPGGLALAAEQIAFALSRHYGKVTVFVPHYAMSGGTIIALAADEIVLNPDAVLGSVDPALRSPAGGLYPASSVLKASEQPNPNRNDQTLILADVAQKAIGQVRELLFMLLAKRHSTEKATELALKLSEGRWTHDHPLFYEHIKDMGLNATTKMPSEIYGLMDLYPQPGQGRPTVEFVDLPYTRRQRK